MWNAENQSDGFKVGQCNMIGASFPTSTHKTARKPESCGAARTPGGSSLPGSGPNAPIKISLPIYLLV